MLAWLGENTMPAGMRLAASLALAALLLAPSSGAARPRKATARAAPVVSVRGQTRFLSKDPHGPLALAKGSGLSAPAASACRTWGDADGVWYTLDRLGHVVGKAEVTGMERYDVTNCDELHLEPVVGGAGAGIFASKGYQAAALSSWKPGGKALAELQGLIRRRDRPLGGRDLPLEQRTIAWKAPDGGEWAVVGGRRLTVLRREAGAWRVMHKIEPPRREEAALDRFMPVAVLDMNGDGKIEIVVHEDQLTSYSDFTLTPSSRGYRRIDAGIHGSTA